MAKINNAQVIQKLVDELKLYPGKDVIPTELAEKILPVFQINSDEVSVKTPTANVVETANVYQTTGTLWTVPATGKFFLTNAVISAIASGAGLSNDNNIIITPKDGAATKLIDVCLFHSTSPESIPGSQQSINLQNPILLEPGSAITLTADTNTEAYATIVGYTESD